MITAGCHGNEPAPVYALYNFLKNKPKIKNKRIVFIPCIVPFGFCLHIDRNCNGIDINRDFFSKQPQRETKFLKQLVKKYNPTFVLNMHEDPDENMFFLYLEGEKYAQKAEKLISLISKDMKVYKRKKVHNELIINGIVKSINSSKSFEDYLKKQNIPNFCVETPGTYPLQDRIKVYEKMMRIMLDKSFKMFSNKQVEFSLNLSYEDISNNAFIKYLYEKVGEFSTPSNIIFEILETDFIEDFSIVEKFTQKIRTFGCKIAIDDFGSGYSSMENILKLKPEIIKIDGSLIKDIDKSTESITIVRNIINMAKELKAETVAEYVHSKDVYEVVKKLGVDYLQGFYLYKPKAFI